jgi:hypothetical protein
MMILIVAQFGNSSVVLGDLILALVLSLDDVPYLKKWLDWIEERFVLQRGNRKQLWNPGNLKRAVQTYSKDFHAHCVQNKKKTDQHHDAADVGDDGPNIIDDPATTVDPTQSVMSLLVIIIIVISTSRGGRTAEFESGTIAFGLFCCFLFSPVVDPRRFRCGAFCWWWYPVPQQRQQPCCFSS